MKQRNVSEVPQFRISLGMMVVSLMAMLGLALLGPQGAFLGMILALPLLPMLKGK